MPSAGCAADRSSALQTTSANVLTSEAVSANGLQRLPAPESIPPGAMTRESSAMGQPSVAAVPSSAPIAAPESRTDCWLFRCFRKLDAIGLSREPEDYRPAPLGANEG
jgi:hypothetical protein